MAVRTEGLRVLKIDGELEALRILTDRREALTRRRVETVNRLQALLAELLPRRAKKDITVLQAKAMLAGVRPRDIAGKTRRRVAAEELVELIAVDAKIKLRGQDEDERTFRANTPLLFIGLLGNVAILAWSIYDDPTSLLWCAGLVAVGVVLFLVEYFFGKSDRPPGVERGEPTTESRGDL